jgi:selenocysteine-specific elongation factor
LKHLEDKTPEELIAFHAETNGVRGVSFSDLTIMTNLSEKALAHAMSGLLSRREIVNTDKENRIYIHSKTIGSLKTETTGVLTAFHENFPLKQGMSKEELRARYQVPLGNKLFNLLLTTMAKEETVVVEEEIIRMADHKVSLAVDQEAVRADILGIYRDAGLTPPFFKDVVAKLDMEQNVASDVLTLLVDGGDIVKVKEKLYFHAAAVQQLRERLVTFLKENGEMTTPQFKEMTGVSRKYLIPLIEYFDAKQVTLRIGDIRKLRKG